MSDFVQNVNNKVAALKEMERIAGYALYGLADPQKVAERMEELKNVAVWLPADVVRAIFWKNGSNIQE